MRLEVLDAVRGLAALCVVFFHVREIVSPITQRLSRPFHILASLNNHGHDAVVVFIVLSGFVLTLPIARSTSVKIPGGLKSYLFRRARRILPPYFAALGIFLLLGLCWYFACTLFTHAGLRVAQNPFVSSNATAGALLAHEVLIFNVQRSWAMAIDNSMWSVATEWQIYFLLPLILLPLWRRLGLVGSVVGGFAVGLLPLLLWPKGTNFDTWCPWMLGDFALGMAAASLAFAPSRKATAAASAGASPGGHRIWGAAFVLAIAAIAAVQIAAPRVWGFLAEWERDVLVGIAVSLLLVYLTRCQIANTSKPTVFRLLDTRAAITLGAFSYSLYLVHLPMLAALNLIFSRLALSDRAHVLAMYTVGPVVALVCGYLFYLAFERPFCQAPSASSAKPVRPAWRLRHAS
jgi:peptidoglycan/LPS O-acetylase OafA/YrhL